MVAKWLFTGIVRSFSGEGYEVNSENALFLSIYEQLSPLSNE